MLRHLMVTTSNNILSICTPQVKITYENRSHEVGWYNPYMPRSPKPRWCQGPPPQRVYKPAGVPFGQLNQVVLGLDELEALRLCDLLGLSQEEAGVRMGVSRGTVQRLLSSARAKVADALVHGKAITIAGADYIRFTHPRRHRFRGGAA